MNARHYDPGTGRFLSQDTYSGNAYEPWTQHLYTYTGNNPVNYVDPTGHLFMIPAAIMIGIGMWATAVASSPDTSLDMSMAADDFAKKDYLGAAISIAAMAIPVLSAQIIKGGKSFIDDGIKAITKSKTTSKTVNKVVKKVIDKSDEVAEVVSKNKGNPNFSQKDIRYTQDSIKKSFKDGGTVDDLATGLKNGSVNKNDIPAIRVFQHNDQNIYSLDNRRLYAFKQAGIDPPQVWAPNDLVQKQIGWKMTTKNNGISIRLR